MRKSEEEEEEKDATAAAAPKPGSDDGHRDAASEHGVSEDDDCDLESLLPQLALGRRIGRQWKPALQSIAEGRD
jgi:hypothetical protein